ncbi:hypothetical protein CCR95_13575 [Thiocystis minor]|uniref:DUF484 family protein n=1 Tax=Thiocystis minor TaxID=61597 RepID=UPI00191149E0|nr:hypothetical protein [Thiocystis minor]
MSSQQAEPATPEDPALHTLVTSYLLNHPTFFEHNPEVLIALRVPHHTGGAISLIEQQVRVLRKQLETERNRLSHLISRAREYETLSARLHGLVLQLLSVNDPDHLCHLLKDGLRREFNAEAVSLKLFPLAPADNGQLDPLTAAFRDFVDREHALCGPLNEEKGVVLFGEIGVAMRTAALIPILADGQSGVLAIGSADPERFRPDMGTDLLDQLGEIVGHKLKAVPLAPCGHC